MEKDSYLVPIPTRMTIWPPSPVYITGTSSRYIKVDPDTTELVVADDVRGLLGMFITSSTMRPLGTVSAPSHPALYEVKIFAVPIGITVSSPPPYNSTEFLVAQFCDYIGHINVSMPMPGMQAKLYIYIRNLTTSANPETLYVCIALEK